MIINLLPPDRKQDYAYAIRNTSLRRWVSALLFGVVGLGLIATYGLVTIQKSVNDYDHKVATTQKALTQQKLTQTENQVKDITNNLKLVTNVLSKEVLFSKLLQRIATVTPKGAILTNLQITQGTNALDLSAQASNYSTASQLQVNLADPDNQIFSKADLVSISCNAKSSDSRYPCSVQVRALFAANNPFLFINSKGP